MKHKKLLVPINGMARSGKDTFCEFMIQEFAGVNRRAEQISSVDDIKLAAKMLGWSGKKDARSRLFLSDLKDLSTEYNDGPFQYMKDYCSGSSAKVIFLHIREPNEIQKIVDWSKLKKFDCLTIKVFRESVQQITNNTGDSGSLEDYPYDMVIDNNGSLADLEDACSTLAFELIKKFKL